jgi:antitoxin MazE
MKTKVIKIGNSRGIRIPKSMLDQSGFGKEVDIQLQEGEIIIHPVKKARTGWSDAFRKAATNDGDNLLDLTRSWIQNQFDEQEWEW